MGKLGWLSIFGVGVAIGFGGCSEVGTQAPPIEEPVERKSLECAITEAVTMRGEPLSLKVPKLWMEPKREMILRADEYPSGQVVRNPYHLTKREPSKEVLALVEAHGVNWEHGFFFKQGDEHKWVLLKGSEATVFTTFPPTAVPPANPPKGEHLKLSCQEIAAGSVRPHEELIPADLPEGCADDTVEQEFASNMIGCSGQVPFRDRGSLCAQGWKPCSAKEWTERMGKTPPQFNYWTEDDLRYSGSSGRCQVSKVFGSLCTPGAEPMRICASTNDPLGNKCNWTRCGLNTTSQNHYFGGCASGDTAGTVCCN